MHYTYMSHHLYILIHTYIEHSYNLVLDVSSYTKKIIAYFWEYQSGGTLSILYSSTTNNKILDCFDIVKQDIKKKLKKLCEIDKKESDAFREF